MQSVVSVARSMGPFALSVLFSRMFSFVTVPILARHLSPADFGELELIASFIEITGLVFSFGLADTLFRFASGAEDDDQKKVGAGLLGAALTLTIVAAVILETIACRLIPFFGLTKLSFAIHCGLLAAALSGLIQTPLAWFRLRNRSACFFRFTTARSIAQATSTVAMAMAGYGVTGMLLGNAAIDLIIAALLIRRQMSETGVRLDADALARASSYGFPIVGGALSMFVLGACDRWFLAGAVGAAELGYYGLAVKFSMIVSLAIQPFGLWWFARRIAVLKAPDGLIRSRHFVSIGMILLGVGAGLVCGGAPIFIKALMPPPFEGAIPYLPWLVIIASLNELCSLVNVGVYATRSAARVLAVNAAGAVVAVTGYALFAPGFGVYGAIGATIAGQLVRLAGFLDLGKHIAPIRYDWRIFFALVLLDIVVIGAASFATGAFSRIAVLTAGLTFISALGFLPVRELRRLSKAEAFA